MGGLNATELANFYAANLVFRDGATVAFCAILYIYW